MNKLTRLQLLAYGPVLVVLMVWIGFGLCTNIALKKHKLEKQLWIEKELDGKIVLLRDIGRGSYLLDIKTSNDTFRMKSIRIGWDVKEYNIQLGDSISKQGDNTKMHFFKLKNGIYNKYHTYTIYE